MKYADLIKTMTLEEKCSLLSGGTQFGTKAIERLGVPAMDLSDGPSGVRKQAGASDHLGLSPSLPATCWPSASTMANTWDEELEEQLGTRLGEEVRAQRVNVLLGPGLNIKRDPRCGRNFEYFSEDPYLSGKLAAAYIRGVQSAGVSACPKHFAVNNQETLRMHSDSVVDERTLREIYLTGFEIAVKEGQPKCIMSSYNRINGVYASDSEELLQTILRDEWGFEGFSVTDWGGSNDRVAGVKAGTHLEMPATGGHSDREVVAAVRAGTISQEVLDRRLDEYLTVLFDTVIPSDAPEEFDAQAHHAFARKAAAEAIVLLKNEGNILPLKAHTKVAVIGDFAAVPRYQGAGSSAVNATRVDIPLDCLKASELDVVGYAPGFLRHGGADVELLTQAVELAQGADVALLYLGLDEIAEMEGRDRGDIKLRQNQNDLLAAVAAVNPNVVVVLACGAPVEFPGLAQCKGLIYGSLGGQGGAAAMVDALTGTVNPSGKLAESWAMVYEDAPTAGVYPAPECAAHYREGLYVGYRYYETAAVPVRFPFGFGLSYTTFAYSDLTAGEDGVTLTVTNTGAVAGAEVVQVYVGKEDSALFRPKRELKGFAKVRLEPGESKQVTIPLDDKAFRFYNRFTQSWAFEDGAYQVMVGASSRDIRLTAAVNVVGIEAESLYDPKQLPSYYACNVKNVPDSEFQTLLGRPIPPDKWDRNAPLGLNDTFAQLCYAKSPIGRLAYKLMRGQVDKAEAAGKPDLDALFRYNMPFRAIAKMMGSAADMAMAEALLEIFNGHFFKGAGHLVGAFFHKDKMAKATCEALANAEKEGAQ